MKSATILFFASMVLVISGCGDGAKPPQKTEAAPPASGPTLPADMVLAAAPAGAKDVSSLVKEAKAGDEIVIRGQIGGDKSPIVEQRAMMNIVDMKLPACNAKPGDDCPTPWDFCCETPESMKANTASIEFDGPDGKPLKVDLRTVNGLKPLSVVVIKGKVLKRDGDNLSINATGIYVEKPAALKIK